MSDIGLSVDEFIAYLQRTTLRTVVVEGSTDKSILRRLEGLLSESSIDFLPADGKDMLDVLYGRREEYCDAPVAFLRDRDEWAIFGIPEGYDEVVFTSGYSIENDVLDRELMLELSADRSGLLVRDVSAVGGWFLRVADARRRGAAIDISRDITAIWDGTNYVHAAAAEAQGALAAELEVHVGSEWIWLRGKTLMRTVQNHFSSASPRYSKDQIVDLCLRMGRHNAIHDLRARLIAQFETAQPTC